MVERTFGSLRVLRVSRLSRHTGSEGTARGFVLALLDRMQPRPEYMTFNETVTLVRHKRTRDSRKMQARRQ